MVARLGYIAGSLSLWAMLLIQQVNAGGGQIAQVVDATNFCTFLPPPDSTDRLIADTEWNGQAFCMGNTPEAINANPMPDGFIQSAHFVATDEYVQVTGQIDPTKANLDPADDGGQYDVKAPNGASCAGWKYFVNLVEPAGNTYCIRCCNDQTNCNRGISQKGCAHIIPGDYSGPMGGSGASTSSSGSGSSSSSSSSSSGSSTTTTTTSSAGGSTPVSSPAAADSSSSSPGASTPSSSPAAADKSGNTGASSSPAGAASSSPAAARSSPAPASSAVASSHGSSAQGTPSASGLDDDTVSAQSVNAAGINSPAVALMAAPLIAAFGYYL